MFRTLTSDLLGRKLFRTLTSDLFGRKIFCSRQKKGKLQFFEAFYFNLDVNSTNLVWTLNDRDYPSSGQFLFSVPSLTFLKVQQTLIPDNP